MPTPHYPTKPSPSQDSGTGQNPQLFPDSSQSEATVEQYTVYLDIMRRVVQKLMPPRTDAEGLRVLTQAMRELVGARHVVLGAAQEQGNGFSQLFTSGFSPEEQADLETPDSYAKVEGVLQMLMEREEPLHRSAAPGGDEEEAFLGLALRCGPATLGALYLTGKAGGAAFSKIDQAHVQGLAVQAALALYNVRAIERERALAARLLQAQEEERRAIAFDLHDELMQYVVAAHIHLETFEHSQENGKGEKAARELAQTSRLLQKSVAESRRLINGLRTFTLDDLGLAGALELLLREEQEHAGWNDAEFGCNFGGQRFDGTLEIAVYRIAQEALTNARKHAHTQRVKVTCERETDVETGQMRLSLEGRDGGCGFDSSARVEALAEREGIGLLSMNRRAQMLGGTFQTHSVPGDGTSILAVFPVSQTMEVQPTRVQPTEVQATEVQATAATEVRAADVSPTDKQPVSVLLVDDHPIWRDGIRSVLEGSEFHVVGEAASSEEALESARRLLPKLVLLDIRMAGGDGLDTLKLLKAEHPQMAVVMLSSYDNATYMARAVAGGAAGYLLKGLKRSELLAALGAVAGGEMLLSRTDLAQALRGVSPSSEYSQDLIHPLSVREDEVLHLLSTGLNNREIGSLLFISENTVKTHVVHIIGKLGVSDRVQAAVWAARNGLLASK